MERLVARLGKAVQVDPICLIWCRARNNLIGSISVPSSILD
jgi:hypothetical protein